MTAMAKPDGDPRIDRVVTLLQHNLRSTLERNFDRMGIELSDEQLDYLGMDLADEALDTFSVDWAPRWVKPGDVHSWPEPPWVSQHERTIVSTDDP